MIFSIFFLFIILFIDKERILRKIIQIIIITEMVGIGIKNLSNFKPQTFIIFKLYLNHICPLLGQIEDAIIINTVFIIFILFFYLLFFL